MITGKNHKKWETSPGFLDGLQNVAAKVEHQHYARTDTLHDMKEHAPIKR